MSMCMHYHNIDLNSGKLIRAILIATALVIADFKKIYFHNFAKIYMIISLLYHIFFFIFIILFSAKKIVNIYRS